jgi:CDP-diacylglycerol---glycerol-3-phosphate 3-phosphatidyltransferase
VSGGSGGSADAQAPRSVEPHWLNPANALTLLRVALVPVIAVLLVVGGDAAQWWAFGIFLFAALTDSIDGWVARRLVGVTRWGQLADPAADKALIIGSLIVLAWLGRLPWWAVAVIVLREVAVTVQRTLLLRRDVVMAASVFGKVKTVVQVIAVTLFLLPAVSEGVRLAALWVAIAATVASGIDYAWRGARGAGGARR